MASLLYLKHTFALSDEDAVERWIENPYWQHFSGERYFRHELPQSCARVGDPADAQAGRYAHAQQRDSKNKLYALHAPEVECIDQPHFTREMQRRVGMPPAAYREAFGTFSRAGQALVCYRSSGV